MEPRLARRLLFGVTGALFLWSCVAMLLPGFGFGWTSSVLLRAAAREYPFGGMAFLVVTFAVAEDAFPQVSRWQLLGLMAVGVALGHVWWSLV